MLHTTKGHCSDRSGLFSVLCPASGPRREPDRMPPDAGDGNLMFLPPHPAKEAGRMKHPARYGVSSIRYVFSLLNKACREVRCRTGPGKLPENLLPFNTILTMKSDLRMPESGTSPSPLRPEDPPHGDNQPAQAARSLLYVFLINFHS